MSPIWVALIAAGAAILSSALTSWLTHRFEHKRRRTEYELKWLEERFAPAMNFLGQVDAVISSVPHDRDERKRMSEKIESIVVGRSKENNAWTVALLLDPEQTGLGGLVFSVMAYGRITESEEAFIDYQVRVHLGLQRLAEEFRRQRQAILSGKSLESIIQERKSELDRRLNEVRNVMRALQCFSEGEEGLDSIIRQVQKSPVRGAELKWMLDIVSRASERHIQADLERLRQEFEARGWLDKLPAQ